MKTATCKVPDLAINMFTSFDWLLTYPHFVPRDDGRKEAHFSLDHFLLSSNVREEAWLSLFLSWKCERLVLAADWYEVRINEVSDGREIQVIVGH